MAGTSEPAFTLFAPLRIDPLRPVSDLDRFRALALPSFRRNLPSSLLAEIVVVVPHADFARATARLRSAAHVPLRVVEESELVSGMGRISGWTKQQLLKLAAPSVVRTPWLITIDSDVVATRRVDEDFLLPGGRAIRQREAAGIHMDWWEASARVLHTPLQVAADTIAFGVTPALLHRATLATLQSAIESANPGRSWVDTLQDPSLAGWTEYTLYWTHVLATGLADTLYATSSREPYALTTSIWTTEDLHDVTGSDLAAAFAPDADHAFFVYQSNLEQPLADVVATLRPHLDGSAGATRAERARWALRASWHRVRSIRIRFFDSIRDRLRR
jgi:hypothetical protein